jgi:1,4-alpha-glucan branching enzyme
VGVAEGGEYSEILNTDSLYYGGGNIGNSGRIETDNVPFHHHPFSLNLTLPPLAVVYLKKKQ